MDGKYYSMLPDDLQLVVDRTEELIGAPVDVVPTPPDLKNIVKGLVSLDCEVTTVGARASIYIPEGAEVVPHMLAHEILHLKRNFLEAVPRLVRKDRKIGSLICWIENDLEHIYIIPEECKYFREAEAYWFNFYDKIVDDLEKTAMSEPNGGDAKLAYRGNMLRHWLVTSNAIPNWPRRQKLRSLMVGSGCDVDGDRLVQRFERIGRTKPGGIAAVVRYLGIPSDSLEMETYNIIEKSVNYRSLPNF